MPQANGEVELPNKNVLKSIRASHAEGNDWGKELPKFLIAYRNRPNIMTGAAQNKFSNIQLKPRFLAETEKKDREEDGKRQRLDA